MVWKEITSLQHPLIKHLMHLRQNSDYRQEHQSVVIEGRHLINEVCPLHHTKLIMTQNPSLVPEGIKSDEMILVNESVFQKASGMLSPEGLLAEIAMPQAATLRGMRWIIACDGVSDPGNMGTLLRSALALGWEGAFILNHSCDPYNDKAIRAAKGATFRLPLTTGSWNELQQLIEMNHLDPLAADMKGTAVNQFTVRQQGILLVLNNEAHGLSQEASQLCKKICIPMPGNMESLNVAVAGGILMYALKNEK